MDVVLQALFGSRSGRLSFWAAGFQVELGLDLVTQDLGGLDGETVGDGAAVIIAEIGVNRGRYQPGQAPARRRHAWQRQDGETRMNRETGGAIGDLDLISQSITDILTTRIGTRIMRREYGSLLPELVDHPFNDTTRLRVYAATVMALMRWEPRISLNRVQFLGANLQGQSVLDLDGTLVDTNEPLSMSLPLQLGASV